MLLRQNETLEEKIVGILAKKPGLETDEIHQRVTGGREYSLPAVYKELKKLREQGVIFKHKKKHSLHMRWSLDMIRFANKITENYVTSSNISKFIPIPENGRKKNTWNFSSLIHLDEFWGNILLTLITTYKPTSILSWNPHPWMYFVRQEAGSGTHLLLKPKKIVMFKIVGGSTFLDKLPSKFWDKYGVQYSFSQGPFEQDKSTYINVVNDFVITVQIDQKTTNAIENYFQKVQSHKDLDVAEVFQIFRGKAKATLKLERNEKRAALYRKKFNRFFGSSMH